MEWDISPWQNGSRLVFSRRASVGSIESVRSLCGSNDVARLVPLIFLIRSYHLALHFQALPLMPRSITVDRISDRLL